MFRIYAALSVWLYCASVAYSWPTLTAVLVNHTQIFDRQYFDYNITPTSAGLHDVYIHVRKNNMNLITNIAIDFETKPHEYGYQFINKTFLTCKFYNSKRFEPLLQMLYKVALENPLVHLPKRCPIKTGIYHYLNASIATDKIPPISTGTKGARLGLRYFLLEKNENLRSVLRLTFDFKLQRK